MGEIGISWRDYLYELTYCHLTLIDRGYRRRHRADWEQARLIAYCAAHAMGGKNIPAIEKWMPLPWEQAAPLPPPPSEAEQRRLAELIEKENQKLKRNGTL